MSGRLDRVRTRASTAWEDLGTWISDRRAVSIPVDLASSYYERDRDSFASVLSSAVAFRLFLFIVPFTLLAVGFTTLLVGTGTVSSSVVTEAGVSAQLAEDVEETLEAGSTTAWVLIVLGLTGSAWAARSFTRTLAATSASAWRVGAERSRVTVRMVLIASSALTLALVGLGFLSWLRTEGGAVGATTSVIGSLGVYTVAWFVVSLSLPRGTSDPGVVLPGTALLGASMWVLHAVGQVYVPARLSSRSGVLGELAVIVVGLGWLFVLGRAMVTSLVLNVVVFERFGSLSRVLFDLPGLRRIPRRWPQVAAFFDLAAERENVTDTR